MNGNCNLLMVMSISAGCFTDGQEKNHLGIFFGVSVSFGLGDGPIVEWSKVNGNCNLLMVMSISAGFY